MYKTVGLSGMVYFQAQRCRHFIFTQTVTNLLLIIINENVGAVFHFFCCRKF